MTYADNIRQIADVCRHDPAYIDGIKAALMESGLAAMCGLMIDDTKLDPYRPCPADWKAFQIAFFDNGEPAPSRNRPKIQRTKMRFGANIMVWTRDGINFSNKSHVAWSANCYFWTAEQAKEIVRDLQTEKYVDAETVAMIDEAVETAGEDMRFAVPLLKIGSGTRWMNRHIVIIKLQDGVPDVTAVHFPETSFVATETPSTCLADGSGLTGRTISQARLARDPLLSQWASELISI